MSCYFRYLKDLLAEAGLRVTPVNKRELDRAIHAWARVPYKRCMPDCWSKVKPVLHDPSKRTTLIAALKRLSSPRLMALTLTASRLKTYASFVKLEHTFFSLPLIYAGALMGGGGHVSPSQAMWILLAAIGGRVMAMGLNRLIDAELDARNPRTKNRELPRGVMRPWEAWMVVAVAGTLYLASAAALSPICLWLSPMPIVLFVGYPYLKRVTVLSHLGLGLAWSMAPLGGWLAVSRSLNHFGDVGWLWLFAILWVAGVDIIYATMDEAFDREFGLHSLPARIGKRRALWIAAALHALAFLALVALWRSQFTSRLPLVWLAGIGVLFLWQHTVADRHPELAFFHPNAITGFLVLGFVGASV